MVNKSLSLFAALLCAHCQSIKGSFIAQFSTLREGSVPRTCELPPWNRHGNGCWTAHHSSGSQRHPDEVSSEKNKNRESGFLFHKILSNRSSFHEIGNSLVKRRLENNLNSHLHPFVQLLIVLVCYMVHLCIFTQNSLAFPVCMNIYIPVFFLQPYLKVAKRFSTSSLRCRSYRTTEVSSTAQ